jgi:hypothetical protein
LGIFLDILQFISDGVKMRYQIIPLEMGSIVERHIFQKNTMEIKCGTVWKLGSILTTLKPSFGSSYDPNLGICIQHT